MPEELLSSSAEYWAGEIGYLQGPFSTPYKKLGLRSFLSSSIADAPLALENLDKEMTTYDGNSLSIPFELYHLRSELHQALGNQELSERDRRSAEESLAAEFAGG